MKYLNLFGDKYYKILANQLPSGLQSSPNLSMVDQIGLFEFDEYELSEIHNNCEKFRYKMNALSPKWMGIKNGVIQITPIDQKVDVEDNNGFDQCNISLIQIWKGYDEWYYTEFRKKIGMVEFHHLIINAINLTVL